jgi:hypothetical protein
MANGFKVFSVSEVLTAADVNDYLMEQSIGIFADATARDAQISSPIEGQFCYLADTNVLQFYNGSAWTAFLGEGDITSVVAGTAMDGGGVSGAVTLNVDVNAASSATPATGDEILIADVSASNAVKKTTLATLPVSTATQAALDAITAGTSTLTIPLTVTVADDGSGSQNVFYIAGGSDSSGTRSPSLDLAVGFKYKFDVSNASNSGHPLKFSTTKDGTHASGSAFTTNVTTSGTAGQANAFVQLEITPETMGISTASGAGTPTLYYYCSSHAGMGGESALSLFASGSGGGGGADIGLIIALG